MKRFNHIQRRILSVVLVLTIALVGAIGTLFLEHQIAKADTPYNTKLLLLHGYNDSCEGAFNYSNNPNYSNPYYSYDSSLPFASIDAWTYLNNNGWAGHIDKVGYYGADNLCDHNVDNPNDNPDVGKCASLAGSDTATNDPIRDLGCKLAWYIYDKYSNTPVYVLAHSMGGLVIRDAIAESHANNSPFPPGQIDVQRVVTVGTPHGGLSGGYASNAEEFAGDTREVNDMEVGGNADGFMTTMINSMQYPQGSNGTYWALMAGSNNDNGGTLVVSNKIEGLGQNNPFPDGDGVVQGDSALSMKADYKILYGKGLICGTSPSNICTTQDPTYVADSNTQYSHEANSCGVFFGINGCLASPFYLNDDSTSQTAAWICLATCNAGTSGSGGIADVHVANGLTPLAAQPAPHSLSEILSLLPMPSPPPPPTATPVPPGACPTHPNDANCDNQDYITQGCNAYPQSQIYKDTVVNMTLYYSTNCQANWTKATIVGSGYVLYSVSIQRVGTLTDAPMSLTDFPTNNMTVWHTRMLWAPISPAVSCVKYKNTSTNAVSGPFCTPPSPVYMTCKNAPNESNCNNKDEVQQGCNDYPQGTATSNGNVTILVHWSTNCQSNWGTASVVSAGYYINKVRIDRSAVSGGLGGVTYYSGLPPYAAGLSNYYSPMVWSPSNPARACVYWTTDASNNVYGPLCTGWH
jgi:hypothetical protein